MAYDDGSVGNLVASCDGYKACYYMAKYGSVGDIKNGCNGEGEEFPLVSSAPSPSFLLPTITLCRIRNLLKGGLRRKRHGDHHRQLLQRPAQWHLRWRRIRRRPHRRRPDVQGQVRDRSEQIEQEFATIIEKHVEGEMREDTDSSPTPITYQGRAGGLIQMITAAYFTCEYMFTARSKRRPDSRSLEIILLNFTIICVIQ